MLLKWDTSSGDPLWNGTQNSGILPPVYSTTNLFENLESMTSYSPSSIPKRSENTSESENRLGKHGAIP